MKNNFIKKITSFTLKAFAIVLLLSFNLIYIQGISFAKSDRNNVGYLYTYELLNKKSEATVYVCMSPNAVAYHDHYCSGLNRCTHSVKEMSVSDAENKGLRPCKICYK